MGCLILLLILNISLATQCSGWVTHHTTGENTIYCKAVVCPSGYQLSFCKHDYTADYCHNCPVGSTQYRVVNSSSVRFATEIPKCAPAEITCPPEAVLIARTGVPAVCECDTTRGYAGEDVMICVKCSVCPPGMELKKDRRCSNCPHGTFKPSQGYGPCKRFTNCGKENRETVLPGNTTADVVCGKSLTTTILFVPHMTTLKSESTPVGLDNQGLDGLSVIGVEKDGLIHQHSQDMGVQEVYSNPVRVLLISVAVQIILLLTILVIIIVGVVKIKRMFRDLRSRRGKDFDKDEERALENDRKKANAYGLNNKYESEPELVSLYQPVTMGTIYPAINSRPCTPTAPQPSILDTHNKC